MEYYKEITALITKTRKDEHLTEQEQSLLNNWIKESEQNKRIFERLTDYEYLRRIDDTDLRTERKEAIRQYNIKLKALGRGWERFYIVRILATIAILSIVVIGLIFYVQKMLAK